jgi:gentisate 1,2-dioxygenase
MLSEREHLSPEQLQRGWREANVKPLWEIPQAHALAGREPAPAIWPWNTMRPLVQRAIELTSPAAAERRVLSLIDPGAREGEFHTVSNLNAGLQVILPGEVARPHRHSADALRFVLDGEGAITRVDGLEATMAEGDLVLTPGGYWHEHWHNGTGPIVWLDVLNVHAHMNLGTMTFEPGPVHDVPNHPAETVLRYPFAEAKAVVDALPVSADGVRRMRYINPLTGGSVMPLLDCYLVRIDAGTTTTALRTNAHAVCVVVEGHGTTATGGGMIEWAPRDVFTLPSGASVVHHATETSYVFVCTDTVILERLGLLTEQIGAANEPG